MINELVLLIWVLFPVIYLAAMVHWVIKQDAYTSDADATHKRLAAEKRQQQDEK